MKLVQLTFQFQYIEIIEELFRRHRIENMAIHPMIEGWDLAGKHDGSQAFPGRLTMLQAEVPEERLEILLENLARFRQQKKAHYHLRALVLPVERYL
jgi:hypothetical protein